MDIKLTQKQEERIKQAVANAIVDWFEDKYGWDDKFWKQIDRELNEVLMPVMKATIKEMAGDKEIVQKLAADRIRDIMR